MANKTLALVDALRKVIKPAVELSEFADEIEKLGLMEQTLQEHAGKVEALQVDVERLTGMRDTLLVEVEQLKAAKVGAAEIEAEEILTKAKAEAQFEIDTAKNKAHKTKTAAIEAAEKVKQEAEEIKADAVRRLDKAKEEARAVAVQRKRDEAALAEINEKLAAAKAAVNQLFKE